MSLLRHADIRIYKSLDHYAQVNYLGRYPYCKIAQFKGMSIYNNDDIIELIVYKDNSGREHTEGLAKVYDTDDNIVGYTPLSLNDRIYGYRRTKTSKLRFHWYGGDYEQVGRPRNVKLEEEQK